MEKPLISKKVIILGVLWVVFKIFATITLTALALIDATNRLFNTNIRITFSTFLAMVIFVLCFGFHKKLFGVK